ncbi:MAG: cytochrome P450, partial [Paracoccaceae bacterium]|nr:cytochrome P450 [Paracoccaceae bacterium]
MIRLQQSPTDPAFVQNPYPFYDVARAEGDFIWWDEYDMACGVSHTMVHKVLRDRRM